MPQELATFLYPKSVAVIGASRSPDKIGFIILKNIINSKFRGKIYPINPNAEKIADLKCYKDLKEIPEIPDLAVLATPSTLAVEILEQCADKRIKNVVILAAGFKEIGPEGKLLEEKITTLAMKKKIHLLGPNCLGFFNANCPINATFGEPIRERGNLRFISQSGAIAASLFDWCNANNIGLDSFITLGNKAVLNENDFLEYFEKEYQNTLYSEQQKGLSKVKPIGLYLESVSEGKRFLKSVSKISKKDPVFILKPGKTEASAKAMLSHTGAIAGENSIIDAAFSQAGAIRCQTMGDFFDLAKAFSWEEVPKGPKIAIISNAGGPGVISVDAVSETGLELAKFDEKTETELSKILPRQSNIINPVDVLGDALADRYRNAAEIVLKQGNIDSLLIILTPQIMTQVEKTAEFIGYLSKKYDKPIFCSFIGGKSITEGEKILNIAKIPTFRFPERAIYAISKMWEFRKQSIRENIERVEESPKINLNLDEIEKIVRNARSKKQKNLDNLSANEIITAAGITTPATQIVESFEQARSFAERNGWKIVLKLSSPGLIHKKVAGGIILNITNEAQLKEAMKKLEERKMDIQIQEKIEGDIQAIIGIRRDPTFGDILLFGAGGSYAELIADRNLHLLPINTKEAQNLVERSKIYKYIDKMQKTNPIALDKLLETIVKMGTLARILPKDLEIEINPVIVNKDNAWAVDPKIYIKP